MNNKVLCPKCQCVIDRWVLLGEGDDQFWEETDHYHCMDCNVHLPVTKETKEEETPDLNTDGFNM